MPPEEPVAPEPNLLDSQSLAAHGSQDHDLGVQDHQGTGCDLEPHHSTSTPIYPPYVVPTLVDPVAQVAVPALGGRMGSHARVAASRFGPIQVAVLVGLGVYAWGLLSKGYCLANGWGAPGRYMYLCYSDIPVLYQARGIAGGGLPYLSAPGPGEEILEYPVLTGLFMYVAGVVTRALGSDALGFFLVNVVAMAAFLALAIIATGSTVRHRPWDALMVAASPAVFLASFVNWDLLAVGLAAAAMWAWARSHPLLAGVLLGLAVSAKFYPVVLLGPLLVLLVQRRRLGAAVPLLVGLAGSWLVVNLPFIVGNFAGWVRFYSFSRERGQDFGSVWYAMSLVGLEVPAEALNQVAMAALALLCLAIVALSVYAPRPPRLASLALLTVVAFVLTNKVYSPQYVLWVLPFAVLARPRWRDLLIWQAGQAVYFVGIWWYLVGYGTEDKGLASGWYVAAIAAHVLGTLWLVVVVSRDILDPSHDPVRTDGFLADSDDPGGGVLDGAPSILGHQRAADPAPSQGQNELPAELPRAGEESVDLSR